MGSIGWIVLTLGVLAALGGLAWWMFFGHRSTGSSARNDTYSATHQITQEQHEMLQYMQQTFPEHSVLFNVRFDQLLRVRNAADAKRAQHRLHEYRIDYLVCEPQTGLPQFAFEMERFQLSNAEKHNRDMRARNRILKTAGIRMLLVRNDVRRMPVPDDLRAQLNLAALPKPSSDDSGPVSLRQQLESSFNENENRFRASRMDAAKPDSEVMTLSQLMALKYPGRTPSPPDEEPSPDQEPSDDEVS